MKQNILAHVHMTVLKHKRNRYVAKHHISDEEWNRRLENFKDVPEHIHA